VPSRDGDEGNGKGVVSNLLDEALGLLDDLVESILGPFTGVHLVASNDELPDTEGEGEQSVLSGLSVLLKRCQLRHSQAGAVLTEIPASNSPIPVAMMRIAQSAWELYGQ